MNAMSSLGGITAAMTHYSWLVVRRVGGSRPELQGTYAFLQRVGFDLHQVDNHPLNCLVREFEAMVISKRKGSLQPGQDFGREAAPAALGRFGKPVLKRGRNVEFEVNRRFLGHGA